MLGERCIGVGSRAVDRQIVGRLPEHVAFKAPNARLSGIGDDRNRLWAEESELEILPVLPIQRAVEVELVVEPSRFPAQLIVGQVVRLVRRRLNTVDVDAIDATRPEAIRPRRVDHVVVVDAPGRVQLVREAILRGLLVQVGAGSVVDNGIFVKTGQHARTEAAQILIVLAEAEKALQRVLGLEDTPPRRQRERGQNVVRNLGERGIVGIYTVLVGQIEGAGPAGDRQEGIEIVDLIVLDDSVCLPLVEQSGDKAQAIVARRGDAHFLAVLVK